MLKKIVKQFKRLKTGILVLTTLTILTTVTLASFTPAQQIDFQTYRITTNISADYCVITSKNVIEIAREVELRKGYEQAWNNSEERNEKLERQLDFTMWYFIGGFALGVYIGK